MTEKYAGACWNQLMENESKESIAEMYMDTRERLSRAEQLNKDFDRVMDDEGIARSCINPLEDLKIAVRALKQRVKELEQENERLKAPASIFPLVEEAENMVCPICGFLCLGNGGMGCIDKPHWVERAARAARKGEADAKVRE